MRSRVLARALIVWHGACMTMASGCFYVLPPRKPHVNSPPEILIPFDNPDTLVMWSDPTFFTVVAHDPDGDRLDCFWEVPVVEHEESEPNPTRPADGEERWECTATVPWDERLDGLDIEATVWDGSERAHVVWHVVIP